MPIFIFNNFSDSVHCGGTLISREYIVTAAHCFNDAGWDNIHKNVINLKCGARGGRVPLNAIKVTKHPSWSNVTHDIAVIQIQKVAYSTTIRPACVISREEWLMYSNLTIIGTGNTRKYF